MISQTAEYALRAVVYLAEDAGAGQTHEQISKATCIRTPYQWFNLSEDWAVASP